MSKDFIFDMETIGADVYACPIVDVSYTTFEWERFIGDPYTFDELVSKITSVKLSITDQLNNYNCSFTTPDLQWWNELPKIAKDKLKPLDTDLTLNEFANSMIAFFRANNNIKHWWSRGNTFDPVLLWRCMRDTVRTIELNQYLPYYNVRDIRTYIDAKFDFKGKNNIVPLADEEYWNEAFVAHNSSHDVAADILRLQTIYRLENGLEQTKR